MDLKNFKRPFHIICSHCGKEVEIYPNDIERRYQKAKREANEIFEQIRLFKSEYRGDYKTNEWFKRTQRAYAHKTKEVADLKQTRKMLRDEAEMQAYRAFKSVVKENVGEETFMKWIAEAEDMIQYSTYDTAKNKYSSAMSRPNDI